MIEIPGYKIHREIDSSDYCHSYSAIQLSTGKTMVVSIFSHSAMQYSSFISVFNDIEQKLANKHFGVITPVKEFIKTQSHTYIISDLLSNSCQQVYKERQIDITTIFEHIYKIALSLNLYHQVGFYHGGVSLDNIYHDADNTLTLGLAAFNQNFNTNENNKYDLNKESYKAPEREISQSKSRDYYALGVVLYELIFKQKPFIATNKKQLNQLKQAAVINIPNHEYDDLKPIFSALLNSDPAKRVSSAVEFKDIVSHANLVLPNISYTIETLDSEQIQQQIKPIKQPQKGIPSYTYYLASIAIIAIVALFLLMPKDDEQPDRIPERAATQDTSSNTTNISSNSSNTSEFDSLIESAQLDFNSQKMASSLMSINQALKIKPNDKNALNIKDNIELELKIKAIIQQASQQIISGNIISPPNNNAIDTYHRLQLILHKGDTRAEQGINKISDAYHRLALKQLDLKNNELAKSILAEGITALPKAKKLKQLVARISKDEANNLKIKREKQLRQEALQAKRLEALESKEKERRLAIIQRNKQLEIAKQKQALENFKIQREKQRQQQLVMLYNEAQQSLTDTQLTLKSIDNAIDNLQSLEFLSVSRVKSQTLRRKIDIAFVSLSEYQISTKQYEQAKTTINKGLFTNSKNDALNSVDDRLNNLLATQEAERKKSQQIIEVKKVKKVEKELPIFGTF